MTEDQIERRVEQLTDRADAALMAGECGQAEYDTRIANISRWATEQYQSLNRQCAIDETWARAFQAAYGPSA